MGKRYLTVVGLVLLFLNLLYCSFAVQLAWITRNWELSATGIGPMEIYYYVHPVTRIAILFNFLLAILLIFQPALKNRRVLHRERFPKDEREEEQTPDRPSKSKEKGNSSIKHMLC